MAEQLQPDRVDPTTWLRTSHRGRSAAASVILVSSRRIARTSVIASASDLMSAAARHTSP